MVPAASIPAVAQYVASLDISVEPDHGMELLRALHAGGRDADVVRLLTDASLPGWAAIIKAGGTFTWETWTPSDLIGDSMSHGWGSSALVAIQEVLLGAVPIRPPPDGPATLVTVTPPPDGLAHASGIVPDTGGGVRGGLADLLGPAPASSSPSRPTPPPGAVCGRRPPPRSREGGRPVVHAPRASTS